MIFEKNAERTFDEAYASIKTDLDFLVARMVNDEKGGGYFDANQWELRLVNRQVKKLSVMANFLFSEATRPTPFQFV